MPNTKTTARMCRQRGKAKRKKLTPKPQAAPSDAKPPPGIKKQVWWNFLQLIISAASKEFEGMDAKKKEDLETMDRPEGWSEVETDTYIADALKPTIAPKRLPNNSKPGPNKMIHPCGRCNAEFDKKEQLMNHFYHHCQNIAHNCPKCGDWIGTYSAIQNDFFIFH